MAMVRRCGISLFVLVIVAGSLAAQRKTEKFDSRWRFHLGDAPGAQDIAFDDAAWRSLDLPHDWSIEGEFSEQNPAGVGGGALPGGVGWYRKTFAVPAADSGKVMFVEFDGVYRNSEVWINGQSLGKRPYGYSSFRYELTPQLRYRVRNVIAVRVDNSQQPNSRWYSGSGIYRHVWVNIVNPLHVGQWGTYVTTKEADSSKAILAIHTTVQNDFAAGKNISVRSILIDEQN